jgi:hypothetical protein
MILFISMMNGKNIPNKRRPRTEGRLAQLIRRKMTQKTHSQNKFNRNELKREDRKGPHYISLV